MRRMIMPIRAKIIEQKVCDGPLGYVHGYFYNIRRLFIEEHDLVITVDGEMVHTFPSSDLDDEYQVVGETEIPSGIFSDAMAHMTSGKRLTEKIQILNDLTGKPTELARSDVKFEITASVDGESSLVHLNDDKTFTIFHLTEGVEDEDPGIE
jgi:hypothetical protein